MRKIRDVLRLRHTSKLTIRQIAESTGIARSSIVDYLARVEAAGLSWPLPDDLDDATLERRLFVAPGEHAADRPLPEWAKLHGDLRRKGVTLLLLWKEYKATHPDGYNYSRFCDLYNDWRGSLDVVMRQSHSPGEKLFVDYAGMTVDLTDPETGQVRPAQIFVAALGASNYTYCEATFTQELADWIGSHQRAFAFFGGVSEIVVPDNLKSGVTRAHRYDPEINRSYAEMAEHYGVTIIPARARKPRDKAKVESAVKVVEQSILAPLRDRTFHWLSELNEAIAALVVELNDRPMQKLPGSRRSVFEEIERTALRPLPEHRYQIVEWKKARVGIDYHIEVHGHYYSVPHRYARRQLDVRIAQTTVECFADRARIAVHQRSSAKGRHSTTPEHMPEKHRQYAEWSPERIEQWASSIGPGTAELTRAIINGRRHPQQGYRTCLGVLRLGKSYGNDRLEAAAVRALAIGALSYRSIESILENNLDRQTPMPTDGEAAVLEHANIRGANYYTLTGGLT